ncbi:putative disease resistance protein RGA3 isoform X2 [Chenopodium quinoa]|uniref:putative disease resistance protein RGA3 isoform X2 n=1 Tax=Chenopodium quinoa TaxID=63459 RepID=UPI000B77D4FF|nr:putative disease resistance protein RGA3 isoform X2 [Chenopodium quinoa]
MSQEVKKIRRKLDAIAKNHSQFGISIDPQPIRRRREETCSYICERSIIGREDDLEELVGHLLNCSTIQQDVSFLTIVGIGGLGKTALAQLVYNDPWVTTAFPLRLWTCVSDHDQVQLDVESILRKIYASTGQTHEESTIERLQSKLREKLSGSKYLLVLDDVWTENRNHWLKLVEFLLGGQRGSWVVVTTRSHKTAQIVGGGKKYELQGLSKENSWSLFKKIAFESEQLSPHEDLLKIGREIVEGCASVPLAIRVAGSLLYGQDKSRWISFQEIGLFNFRESQKDIMPILMFSYHQLELPLKSCFTYCALFPKDTVIKKELLISLWLAQGYVVPLDDGQRLEDAVEEYFTILMRRCFFQDVKHDEYGDIISCKIHDLMHDIAQNVAGKEICFKNSVTDIMDREVRHISHVRSTSSQYSFSKTHIRSFLDVGAWYDRVVIDESSLKALVANWRSLRVLDLSKSRIECLPHSIGELLHLRYLDLSDNDELDVLPQSITKLYNLQTLKLCMCEKLKELSKDLMKLVNLRILKISDCDSLTNMPKGVSKLSCLRVLSDFVVDGLKASRKQWFDQLGELKRLNSLKGHLSVTITFFENARAVKEDIDREGAYLRDKEHLKFISIRFNDTGNDEVARRLMEELQPHPNLRGLELHSCVGMRMPSWARENKLATSLPNLNRLDFFGCRMEDLTCLGNLRHLEFLQLFYCRKLKYIFEKSALAGGSDPNGLFPRLRKLVMEDLPELQGWTNIGEGVGDNNHINSSFSMAPIPLPQLTFLWIEDCPNLTISECPNVNLLGEEEGMNTIGMPWPSFSHSLRNLTLDNLPQLVDLPNWMQSLAALQTLHIGRCSGLECMPDWMPKLTSLRILRLYECSKRLKERCQQPTGEDWPHIQHIPSIKPI